MLGRIFQNKKEKDRNNHWQIILSFEGISLCIIEKRTEYNESLKSRDTKYTNYHSSIFFLISYTNNLLKLSTEHPK